MQARLSSLHPSSIKLSSSPSSPSSFRCQASTKLLFLIPTTMAGELVGGALLSAFLQVAIDRLASPQVLHFFRGSNLDEKQLKWKLRRIYAVVDDAEQKQFRDSLVRGWLVDVKDVLFEAEDLLDEIDIELSKYEVEAESQSIPGQVLNSFTSYVISLDIKNKIQSKIKKILGELDDLASQISGLGLKRASDVDVRSGSGSKVSQISQSSSLPSESVIYGRDDDKETIINWLTSDTDKKLSILSIVGMGGLGKTTLAQLGYNDPKIEGKFNIKAWVSVPYEFDVLNVSRAILDTITDSTNDCKELEMIQRRLKENLTGRRFLLVLDDIWNESQSKWEQVQKALNFGAQGSRILVTTRSKKVASTMLSEEHNLKQLPQDYCLQLFAEHAFKGENRQPNPVYKELGMKIVGKCKGLPLTLKTMGCLLYKKSSIREWESILKSEIWEFSENDSDIIPGLRLSYHYLPSHLKICFAYCALFPKGYVFDKECLIQLWMAENFLHCPQQSKSPEEVGEEYFNDLLSWSFFQQSSNTKTMFFVMHDLLNDLARCVSRDICFRLEVDQAKDIPKTTRHFSFEILRCFDGFGNLHDHQRLHTFMPTNRGMHHLYFFPWRCMMSIDDLFSKFKFLRVLSLSGYSDLKVVPDSVGYLHHLRSLDLSHTNIIKLPESTRSLYNLQILKLDNCTHLKELPSTLHKLTNLRVLSLSYCPSLIEVPNSVGDLKHLRSLDLSETYIKKLPDSTCLLSNLQILKLNNCKYLKELPLNLHKLTSLRRLEIVHTELRKVPPHLGILKNLQVLIRSFDVGKSSDFTIQQLGELNLHGSLSIRELQNIENPSHASALGLKNKIHLVELVELKWHRYRNPDDSEKERDENVIKNLQPSEHLKKLSIWSYGGTKFPSWLSDNSLRNVVSLNLDSCQSCLRLPCLGRLPFLKELVIQRLDGIVNIDAEFHGSSSSSFTSLEILKFHHMRGWEKWVCQDVTGAFPRLQHLSIEDCPKLKGRLPVQLVQLKTLSISFCKHLVDGSMFIQEKSLSISSHIMEAWLLEGIKHIISDTSLQQLFLHRFPNIPMSQSYDFLGCLIIDNGCDSLVTFPLDSFPTLGKLDLSRCPNLQRISQEHTHNHLRNLRIKWCPQLESLPERMQTLLPSLKELHIRDCPKVELFPEGGLPSNLRSLSLYSCSKFIASLEMASGAHLSLETLHIGEMNGESFPAEDLLPLSLTYLCIRDCPNLQCLPEGLCHLSSLQKLDLLRCPNLQCLPEGLCHLSSLQKLDLNFCESLECLPEGLCQLSSLQELVLLGCPKLQCLPENGLPKSISTLQIWSCPLLHHVARNQMGKTGQRLLTLKNSVFDDSD